MKWSKEKMKEMNPKEKDHESVLVQKAITIPFSQRISLCAVG